MPRLCCHAMTVKSKLFPLSRDAHGCEHIRPERKELSTMKHCFRRLGFILFAFCLTFAAALAETTLFSAGSEFPQDARLSSATIHGDCLFVYEERHQTLYQFSLTDGSSCAYPIWNDAADGAAWHEAKLCTGDDLCAIEVEYAQQNGRLSYKGAQVVKWTVDGNNLRRADAIPIDLSDFVEDAGFQDVLPNAFRPVWTDACRCIFVQRTNAPYGELYSVSASGKLDRLSADEVSTIISVKGSRILFSNNQESRTLIQTLDIAKGKINTLVEFPYSVRRVCYDVAANELYYVTDAVHRLSTRNPDDATTYVGNPFSECTDLLCKDGKIIYCGTQQLAILSPVSEQEARTLNFAGSIIDNAFLSDFQAKNSAVLLRQGELMSEKQIITNILTQNSDVDLYELMPDANQIYPSLRSRGFCPALTTGAPQSFADALYPEIRGEFLDDNGRVCALPTSYRTSIALGVNINLWNQLSFGGLPKTWSQFFDFLENQWADYSRNNAGERLLSYDNAEDTRSAIFYALKADYESYHSRTDTPNEFSTPIYQSLLKRLLSIDFNAFQYSDDVSSQPLLTDWFNLTPEGMKIAYISSTEYLPLSIDGVAQTQITLHPGLVFINPYTKNMEDAQAFMECLAENMNGKLRIALQPDYCTPVKSEDYDSIVEMYTREDESLRAQLESADAAQRTELSQMIEDNMAAYQESIRTLAYSVAQEDITAYKALATSIGMRIIYKSRQISESLDQLGDLGEQVMQGQISVEQYTSELDRIQVQSEKEGQ